MAAGKSYHGEWLNNSEVKCVVSSSAMCHGKVFHARRRTVLQVPLHALFSTPLAMESLFPFGRVLANLDHLRSELRLQGLCRKLPIEYQKSKLKHTCFDQPLPELIFCKLRCLRFRTSAELPPTPDSRRLGFPKPTCYGFRDQP